MPKRNGATIDVDLLAIESEFLLDGEVLTRERFIDLDEVEVVDGPAGLLEAVLS